MVSELIINIEHFGWCANEWPESNDAHYIYSALGRYFTLCHIEKEILGIVFAPPQFVKCDACLERIKTETELITA